MRAWVDLFSARVPAVADPEAKALRRPAGGRQRAPHDALPRAARSPTASTPTPTTAPREGEVIYERIDELAGLDELAGYALGSLDHFSQLLAVYRDAADGEDRAAIDDVTADVQRMRAALGPLDRAPTARAGPPRLTSSTASASWSRRRATRMPAEAALPSFADLQRELSPISPRAWRFAAAARGSRAGSLLSDGLRIGYRHGFDSGPFMAHVYANRPSGRTIVGRAIDRRLLAGARASPSATSARWPSAPCSRRCAPRAPSPARRRSSPTSPPGRRLPARGR